MQQLAQMSSEIIVQEAPVGIRGRAGLLQQTLSEIAGPEPTEQGWWAGVGNLEGIYPLKTARKGTIAAFLEKWRKPLRERFLEMWVKDKGGAMRPRKRRAGTSFNPKKAWWYLTEDQKRELRAMREAGVGDVGGASPYRPFYWHIQETGMEAVGIPGSGYITAAITAIKGQIQQVIDRVLNV